MGLTGRPGQHGPPTCVGHISGCVWLWDSWCQLVSDWHPGRELQCAEVNWGAEGWEGTLSCVFSHQALKSIPQEEQREAALSQLNEALLELCAEQRPTQSDLLHQTWCAAFAG